MIIPENKVQGTIGQGGARVWLYPKEVKGFFMRRRTMVAWVLLIAYLITPWLHWKGEPLFQIDIFGRQLIIATVHYFEADLRLFLPGIFAGVLIIFLVTARYGRIWCGWACPQTVFLQFVFEPIERAIEGKASIRKKRNEAGFSVDWLWRKVLKQAAFLWVSLIIGNTVLAYFWGSKNVIWALTHSPFENITGFTFVILFTLVFYWVFAYFREQACIIVCPYAKFQSVLTDDKTLLVAYDSNRGEPRSRQHDVKREGLGDCVDCKQCVQVCPTGIDIRQGQQLECIGCTKCLDACDSIMQAWKKPKGLIRYASLRELENKKPALPVRQWIYAGAIILLISLFLFLIFTRNPIGLGLTRTGSNPYLMMGPDSVMNMFTLHVQNKDKVKDNFTLQLPNGLGHHNWEERSFSVGSGQLMTLPITIIVPRSIFESGKKEIVLTVSNGKNQETINTTLIGPF